MKKTITLRKHEDHRIRDGHLWVFSNEIREIAGQPQTGDWVLVRDNGGVLLGSGFYHANSLIAVRLYSRKEEEPTTDLLRQRLHHAVTLRERIFPGSDTFRLVHGESDFLPGLVIDKFGEYVSVQSLSAGIEQRIGQIYDLLGEMFHPAGIVERNDVHARALEGLEERRGVVRGDVRETTIHEHGLSYSIDLVEGQKTGFFLDQRLNRLAFRTYTNGQSVLDCFCNEGGFALNAAKGGASHVTAVDISSPAIRRAAANAERNGLSGSCTFAEADVFDFLDTAAREGLRFDVVNLDPPSFAKNKKGVTAAKRGYRDLHIAALNVLAGGGILATASCSHHVTEETFLDIVCESASRSGRTLQLLEWRGASPDHPVLPGMPETSYLKFGIFRVS